LVLTCSTSWNIQVVSQLPTQFQLTEQVVMSRLDSSFSHAKHIGIFKLSQLPTQP
jgi:hypothetical protein